MITSDSKDDNDTLEPLPSLPKLIGADPFGASKMSQTYVIKKRTESKQPAVQSSCPDKNALPSTEQLLLTLMEEVKAHEIADCPKNLRNSRKPRVAIKQSEPTEKHMTGVKQYLHRYSKEPGPKVVFGDDSSEDTKGYGSVNYEYSRYTWVFFLKKKSDAFDYIMYFIRKMENLNEVRVKKLRSDNGIEFRNHKLEEFCDEKGILQNFSSPCTHEQNGIAKRRNKTLIEAARTMLNSAKLPKQFWGEAVNTTCYTQNRSIIVKRHGKTANDVFRGRSLDISYFHVFGVFNIRRKEMEETVHVTFSEDDEAISQSSTEGDAINFNENRSFPDDEFLEPRSEVTQCIGNTDDVQPSPTISPSANVIPQILIPQDIWSREKHIKLVNIIGEPLASITTRSRIRDSDAASAFECLYVNFLSEIEPKKLIEALEEEGWIIAMKEELNQFKRNKVWTLVLKLHGKTSIGTKWIWKNKMDENGIVIKNKARLVAQGYNP
ncbi:retrovirus-related pol polyprotein from transposon TNT 1-94 [Tanacetum coccineum]